MLSLRSVVVPLFVASLIAQQPSGGPLRFEDFEVARERVAHPAKVQFTDAKSRQYATQLRAFGREQPNFAGHYVLVTWGGGASCVMVATIDVKTGDVVWLPFTVCCWDANVPNPLDFRTTSRLLIVHGSRNEQGGGTYDYRFDGKGFKLLEEQKTQ